MNIAIVGATGNVGRKTLEVLEKKELPIYKFKELDKIVKNKKWPNI